jgi:amino acid adenylation domain-containing protein
VNPRCSTKHEREIQVHTLAREEAQRPFVLEQGPLVRTTLLRLNAEEHVLLVTIHHIVSDGWSQGVFWRELQALYEAFATGKPSPLPELSIQYVDFAHWQRQWLQGELLEAQLAYWKQQLADVSTLQLPTDRPRPTAQTFRGARHSVVFSPPLMQALKALSQQQEVTLFMTLLATFQALLYRYTGQDDIVVGFPIAGRNRREIEGLIGFFVNTLVLRTNLSGNPSFRALLSRVRKGTLEAYSHQDFPYEKLVEELQPQRDLSRNPLCQVMFVLQNTPQQAPQLMGLTLSALEIDPETAKFDLTLNLAETPEGLRGWFEYSTDLFDAATIARMAGHFQILLEGIVADPEQRLSTLPLLTADERHQLLVEWNTTAVDYPQDKCLHELFEAQVEQTPDAVAVLCNGAQLTYRELNQRANQLARYLRTLGIGPEARVGICLERSLEMSWGLLGILKAGWAYVPLDPGNPRARLAFMLEDAHVQVLLTQKRLIERLPAHRAAVVCLDAEWEAIGQASEQNLLREGTSANLAYVMYTSGSTGKPKGILISHRSLVHYLHWCIEAYAVRQGQGAPVHSSLAFDLTITSLFTPLMVGQKIVLVPDIASVEGLSAILRTHANFSLVKITPAHLKLLHQQLSAEDASGRCRSLVLGGEALTTEDVACWQAYTGDTLLFNEYGPTETTVGCCVYRVPSLQRAFGSIPIGRPIANTQVYVLDSYQQPVPIGVPGELYVGGVGLARGYLNHPKLTAEHFLPHPFSDEPGARLYRTEDLARYRPDGNIEFLGRLDHQVKIRGFRVELGEVEAVLAHHPAIHQAVVLARQDIPDDSRLVAYLVTAQDHAPTISELCGYLKKMLPDYMLPSTYIFLDTLPLTPNGKVDRHALPASDQERPKLASAFVAPRTSVEKTLARIWAEVLRIEHVGVHDNFFALGGHSLLAGQVVYRVLGALQVHLPLRSLFEAPTVSELAEYIEAVRWVSQDLLVPPRRDSVSDHEEGEL